MPETQTKFAHARVLTANSTPFDFEQQTENGRKAHGKLVVLIGKNTINATRNELRLSAGRIITRTKARLLPQPTNAEP